MTTIICAILIWLCPPVTLLAGWGFMAYWVKSIRKLLKGTADDFWLNPDEKKQFKDAYENYQRADKAIWDAELSGERAGISRNADGQWSLRSNLGKEIRATIEQNEGPRQRELSKVRFLENLPSKRWDAFCEILATKAAFTVAFIVFVIGFLVWCRNVYPDFLSGMENISTLSVRYLMEGWNPDPTKEELYFHGTLVAICVIIIAWRDTLFAASIRPSTPRPEVVTTENVDKFCGGSACTQVKPKRTLPFEAKWKIAWNLAQIAFVFYVIHLLRKCG